MDAIWNALNGLRLRGIFAIAIFLAITIVALATPAVVSAATLGDLANGIVAESATHTNYSLINLENYIFYFKIAAGVWLYSIFATLIIAKKKGKNLLLWGIAALLFGVFVLLLAVLTPAQKRCHNCAEYVALDAWVCKHCHSKL